MPKISGVNHQKAIRALEKAGFRVARQGKHVVMTDGRRILTIPRQNPINALTMGASCAMPACRWRSSKGCSERREATPGNRGSFSRQGVNMSLRKPRLSCGLPSSTFALLRDALSQFHVRLEEGDEGRELKSLKMDDLDFVEALELIECVIGAEIPKPSLHASITIDQVVDCIEKARRVEVRSAQPHQGPNNG